MGIKEWMADNFVYRFAGNFYSKSHDHIFDFIKSKTPKNFLDRNILDLGCGDGTNTKRVERIFEAKSITGIDRNKFLVEKAKQKGVNAKVGELNKKMPKGEMATFIFSLHHVEDKVGVLKKAKKNFDYIFLCEPCNDLWHKLFDAGHTHSRRDWVKIFDEALGQYKLYQYKNNLVVFYSKK